MGITKRESWENEGKLRKEKGKMRAKMIIGEKNEGGREGRGNVLKRGY